MSDHLIFELNATRYAIPAETVRSTFWLPELAPVEDLPPYFVGLINLHGEVLAVVDLGQRFGHPAKPYRLNQAVVLLEHDGYRLGLVADQVHDLVDIAPAAAAPYVHLEGDVHLHAAPVIAGTLKWEDTVLILLDATALLRLVIQVGDRPVTGQAPSERFAPLNPQEQARLRARTHRLALPDAPPDPATHVYALIRIGSGRYAIELQHVAEFTHLGHCTPIPCCPPHIIGCVNLRGAILTVVDLAPLVPGKPSTDYTVIVVLQLGDQRLGLAAHQVSDIRSYADQALAPLTGQAYGHPHCKWMLHDEDGVAGVLDFDALLQHTQFEVNEQA